MAKKKANNLEKEPVLTPTARAYINMVQDSIARMESADEKLSPEKKMYIETLKENIKRAPEWFKPKRSNFIVIKSPGSNDMTKEPAKNKKTSKEKNK